MAEKFSATEQQYYQEVVESTVRQAVKLPKDKAEAADKLLDEVLKREHLHEELKLRFRREVMQRVAALRQKTKTEQEEKILNKFQDDVNLVDGKFRPSGVDNEFSVRVKAGNIFHRVFGKTVEANDMDGIMREMQEIEDRIDAHKAELAVLTAAKESSSRVLANARDIFKARMEARGTWNTIFSTELHSVTALSAAWDQRQRARHEYEQHAEDKAKKLKKDTKTLEDHKKILEAALAKVQSLRERGRELFQKNFAATVETLQAHKDQMDEAAYNEQLNGIRKQVAAFGKDIGVTHMEFFLNEALGIKPAHARDLKNVYLAPTTALEKSREDVQIGRLWKDIFGSDASGDVLTNFIQGMRESQPELLRDMVKNKKIDDSTKSYLQFFFTGKIKDRKVLSDSRLASLTPENVVKFMGLIKEYSKDTTQIDRVLNDFATHWPDHYKSDDFDVIYDQLLLQSKRPELMEQLREQFAPTWRELTGKPLEATQYNEIVNHLETTTPYSTEGPQMFFEKLQKLPAIRKELYRFFFDGKFDHTTFISEDDKLLHGKTDEFFQVHKTLEECSKERTTKDELKGIFSLYPKTEEYEKDGLREFSPKVYKRLLLQYRQNEADKKKKKNSSAQGAQALPN